MKLVVTIVALCLLAPGIARAQAALTACSVAYIACTRGYVTVAPIAAQPDSTLGVASYTPYGAMRVQPMAAGADVGASNPLPVSVGASGAGVDASANAATPSSNVLTSFMVTNPGGYRIWNQSGVTLQVQMCTSGGTQCTIELLSPGSGPGAQGADTSPEIPWFTGLINVLGPVGSQVAVRHN